ncbi:hypothetical protein ACO1MO_13585, partial [Staphylococcus aureus]
SAQPPTGSPSARSMPPSNSFRALLESRRALQRPFGLEETVALIVPLAIALKDRHDRGERFFVHPSSLVFGEDGRLHLDPELGAVAPTHPRDIA